MKKLLITALLLACVVPLTNCATDSTADAIQPVVSSITPTFGPRQGGTEVIIKGENFTPETIITIGDAPVTDIVFIDENTIMCKTPERPGGTNAGILAVNPGNAVGYMLGQFYYIPAPRLVAVDPRTGPPPGGETVTLSGSGFVAFDAGPNTVVFGLLPATNVVTVSDTTITCTVPGPSLGPTTVTVTNANGTATKARAYNYYPPPTADTVTPDMGSPLGGTNVTVTGTGFQSNDPGPNAVTFGGNTATNVVVVNDGTLTCDTPPHAPGLVDVIVTNANGFGISTGAFTFFPYPTLSSVAPNEGKADGGDTVTLTGTGFVNNMAGPAVVKFGGNTATNVVILNDTTLTCKTPALPSGTMSVTLTNNNGLATLVNGFTAKLSALLGATTSQLYRVDITNGTSTPIGSGIGFNIIAMATHPDGTIYAITTSQLIKINVSTGTGTLVAGLSQSLNASSDLAFKGTALYAGNYIGQTYLINTATGGVTTKNTSPYYYGGQRKCGFHYTGSQWNFMTYDGYYNFFFDPEVGGYPSYTYGLNAHAMRAIGAYKGIPYGINCQAGSSGTNLSLGRFDTSLSSFTTLGALPSGMLALTGTD